MKHFLLSLVSLAFLNCACGQETEHYTVRVTVPGDPNTVIGVGDFSLTGTKLLYVLPIPVTFVSTGTVNIVSGSEPNGTILFPLDGPFCSADRGCGFGGESQITPEQAALIRSGSTQVVVDELYRGLILTNLLCGIPSGISANFEAILRGRDPRDRRIRVQWGTAAFTLHEHLLQYEVELPSAFGPYTGWISIAGRDDPSFLGTLDCQPGSTSAPPAGIDFDELPRCKAAGSLCISDQRIADLLAGQGMILIDHPIGLPALGDIAPVDTDRDGVPDYRDTCLNTQSGEVVNASGCSIAQLAPCAGPWKNHGEYVNRVREVTSDFVRAGLITEDQRRTLLNQAAQSGCGGR